MPLVAKEKPFIFIEDGSHKWSEQIQTFEDAFVFLAAGGYYVCEDLSVAYGKYRS